MESVDSIAQPKVPELVKYPDPLLLTKAKEVKNIDEKVISYFQQMKDVMREYNGMGLAAPQIGLSLRLIIVKRDEWIYEFINPRISWSYGLVSDYEGCLSLPGEIWQVVRSYEIVVEGVDLSGREQSVLARGLIARVFQHEVDHLDGVLINSRGSLISAEKDTLQY